MPEKFPAPQINICVVGLGRMGKRHCKTLIYRAPQAKLTAVCTPAPAELKWARNFFGPESGVEMLEQPGLQAVWVSTSTDLHARVTTAAIHKDLDVLYEKPLSYDLEERPPAGSRRRPDLAKQNTHLKIMAACSCRFDASQAGDLRNDSSFIRARCGTRASEDVVPKRVFAVGTIAHHEGLAEANDINSGIAVVENWDGKMAYFYASRTQTHGHDVANEANELLGSVAEDKPVPVGLDLGLKGMEIGWALKKALWEGRSVTFDRQGRRVEEGGQATGV
ncbi:hypothetical protein IWZ03DRAFT_411269 [Phyllosticta citriasiana]|uniref:Gfo/Idh/MocA-like oxidoreductase N-terminal domain-containing protein n=1 Tax=Phyllosticta citriasiana TaxID=595635 RepID=A0ABR1L1R0_9PEZI